jgi:hypothetical protein
VRVALFALLRILTGKRKLAFPGPLFIPDKGAWPDLPSIALQSVTHLSVQGELQIQ